MKSVASVVRLGAAKDGWDALRDEVSKLSQMGWQSVQQAMRVGDMLIKLKAVTPYRQFHSRVNEIGITQPTSSRLMTLAQVKAPASVILNLDNPMVAQVRREEITTSVVIMAACLIGAEHCYAPDSQPLLPGIPTGTSTEDFSKAVGTILSTDLAIDGKPALYPVAA